MISNPTPLDGKAQFDDMAKWAAKKMEADENGGLAFLSRRNACAIAAYVAGLEAQNADEFAAIRSAFPRGTYLTVKHDGFEGLVIGYYMTLENKPGLVLQFTATRIVHVYSAKWFEEKDASQ